MADFKLSRRKKTKSTAKQMIQLVSYDDVDTNNKKRKTKEKPVMVDFETYLAAIESEEEDVEDDVDVFHPPADMRKVKASDEIPADKVFKCRTFWQQHDTVNELHESIRNYLSMRYNKPSASPAYFRNKEPVYVGVEYYVAANKIKEKPPKSHGDGLGTATTAGPSIMEITEDVCNSLVGIAYLSKKQVVKIAVVKLVDKEEPFDGRTVVTFKHWSFEDLWQDW